MLTIPAVLLRIVRVFDLLDHLLPSLLLASD